MTNSDRSILTVTCYGHLLSHFNMLVFPAILLPLSGMLAMEMRAVLNLAFWMYLLFGFTALGWGMLADKFGPRRLLALFYGGAGLSAFWAATVMDNPGQLSLALAAIGFFSGIYHPAGLGWIAKAVERTSLAMAYNGMFGNLGLALGPLMAGLVNYFSGPQTVYVVVGIMNLFGLLLLLGTRKNNTDARVVRKNDDQRSWPSFVILMGAMMLGGVVYRGITVTLPALFELQGTGLYTQLSQILPWQASPNVMATSLVSLLFLIGMGGQYYGGHVGERHDLRWSYFLFHLLTIPAAFLISLTSDIPLVLLAIFHSFFLLGMQPIENTLVARLTPPNLHSSAYGLKFVVTFGVGSLAVKMVHFIEAGQGIEAVFPMLGFVSILLLGVIALLIRATPPMRS
ncbi:MAG: MFS transporter [Thermodesulfobacteriota bacterium]